MARNFWKSFYQGWDAGDKIYDRTQELARRRDIAEASKIGQSEYQQYGQDDVEQMKDPLEQAGGQWDAATQTYKMGDGNNYAPRQAPVYENGGYTMPDGRRATPGKTMYSLDGQTRGTRFTDEEVNDAKLNRMASVYEKYGDVDKAMSLRANSQTMKLGKVQYENALRESEQAKNGAKILKLQQQYASGALTPKEFMSQLINATDPINNDGITHTFEDMGDGNYYVQQYRNNEYVGSKTVTPEVAFREALRYSSPTMFNTIFGQDVQKAGLDLNREKFEEDKSQNVILNGLRREGLEENRRQFDVGLDWKTAEHNDEMDYKRRGQTITENYYNGIINKQNYLNPLQQYQLDELKQFDTARKGILADLDSGRITEKEADRQLNRLGKKFGSAPLREQRDTFKNPKEAMDYAAGLYGPEWETMPRSKRQEVLDGLLEQQPGASATNDAPPDMKRPNAPTGRQKTGLQSKPAPAPAVAPAPMMPLAPRDLPMGGQRDWFDRGITPSTIGNPLPWARGDFIK